MRRIAVVIASVAMVAAALSAVVVRAREAPTGAPVTPAAAGSVSPVFGVNMSLFDGGDELATDAGTQAMLRSWRVPLIRVPMSAGLPDSTLIGALRAVQAVGATPMVILHGPKTGSLADNQHLLSLIVGVFDDRPVYLEYGNEQDLAGVDAAAYVASWNQVVPALKKTAPAAYKFVGPANFQADPAYVAAFVRSARPAPDYLSWHEYVCDAGNDDSYCLAHIANWATHAADIEKAVQTAVGRSIPFFISEWNLDPNDEQRYADAAFIQSWTRTALTQLLDLVPAGLAGAMLYTATNHGDFGLIDGGRLTPQGMVFRDVLATAAKAPSPSPSPSLGALAGVSPPAVVAGAPDAGPTTAGTGGGSNTGGGRAGGSTGRSGGGSSGGGSTAGGATGSSGGGSTTGGGTGSSGGGSTGNTGGGVTTGGVSESFESGLGDWDEYWGYSILSLSLTSSVHYAGGSAMKMTVTGTDYAAAGTDSGLSGVHGGSTVTFHVYSSGTAGTVRPFVMDPSSNVHWPQGDRSLPGSAGWFTLSFTVPSGFTVHAIGLQLHSSSQNNWIALDGLSWP